MELTFLGTGSAMPTGERFQTGLLLDSDQPLLVDCGSGILRALARTKTGYEGIDTVLLTHHHLDHIADLLPLLKARWLAGETTLTVAGPPGTEDLIDGLLGVHEYMQGKLDLTVREVDTDEAFALAGYDIRSRETEHSMYCLAYRFEREEEPAVVYSGDTEASTGLLSLAEGAAVLVHDCSFPDEVDVDNHPTPSKLGRALADSDADIGRVYLTHLYPHTEGRHEAMLDSLAEAYDGDVRFARDGLTVTVGSVSA